DRVRRRAGLRRMVLRPGRAAAASTGALMDAALFLADLERKPARLAGLAAALRAGDPWGVSEPDAARSWVFVGMGSSAYAAQVAAARLRSHGVRAVAELASTHLLPQVDAGTT